MILGLKDRQQPSLGLGTQPPTHRRRLARCWRAPGPRHGRATGMLDTHAGLGGILPSTSRAHPRTHTLSAHEWTHTLKLHPIQPCYTGSDLPLTCGAQLSAGGEQHCPAGPPCQRERGIESGKLEMGQGPTQGPSRPTMPIRPAEPQAELSSSQAELMSAHRAGPKYFEPTKAL